MNTTIKQNILKHNNFLAVLILVAVSLFMLVWLIPAKAELEKQVSKKYNQVAIAYDQENISSINHIENEIKNLQVKTTWYILLQWLVLSFAAITFTGLAATWLQYIYTNLKFTQKKFYGEDGVLSKDEQKSAMIVLASALLVSGIIVTTILILLLN